MGFGKGWFTVLGGSRGPQPGDTRFLQPSDRFRAILDRERKRVDRTGGEFSLLVYPFEATSDTYRAGLARLAEVLQERLRDTDVAGFLENGHVAVLLSGTGPDYSQKVASEIFTRCASNNVPECEVYNYPSQQLPELEDKTGSADADQKTQQRAGIETTLFVQQMPVWKRAIDIVGASFGLIVLSPLLLGTALAIRLTSKGPAFFAQRRAGLGGRPFTIYKFRTMCVDAEELKAALRKHSEQDGPAFKMTHDPRITTLGRYLRKTCIDELPQLLNVLKGDMSLVGPRPLPCDESSRCETWQRRRLEVTPGLTCIWQIDGKSRVPFTEWMRMDIRYGHRRTFRHDIKLVFRTIGEVLLHRGSG